MNEEVLFIGHLLSGFPVPILPIRLLLALLSILVAWSAGKIALWGQPEQVVNAAPFTGWRLVCRNIILWCSRGLFFAAGIQRIEFVGERAGSAGRFTESSVAPIIISAPHWSYLDAFISGTVDITPVIKASAGKAPIFGRFLTALQPIFVNREKAERYELGRLLHHYKIPLSQDNMMVRSMNAVLFFVNLFQFKMLLLVLCCTILPLEPNKNYLYAFKCYTF